MTQDEGHERRDLLRAYLLGTLSEAAEAQVEARLEAEPAWREALEKERAALATLDALPEEGPPPGLAASTIARVEEEGDHKPAISLRILWPAALAAALLLVIGAPVYFEARQNRIDALAAYNLEHIGSAMKMYADESEGERFPPLAPYDDLWIFDVRALYPEYLSDLTVLASPRVAGYRGRVAELAALQQHESIDWERVNRIAAESYTYLGYMVTEPQDIEVLAQARTQLARAGREGSELVGEDKRLLRLREGIERFLLTDINNPGASARAQSEILLLMETPPPASDAGRSESLALYLDGHVERLGSDSPLLRDAELRSILRSER